MRNKIVVFLLTFAVMVLATPFVFDKLMNSKFNQMLDNFKKEGYVIKQIENKSSYLTTDRVFEVLIPGEKIDESGYIKDIVLEVEAKFRNLPVTDVGFFGKVLKVESDDKNFEKQINKIINNKIKFIVITPNFKIYKYKLEDTTLQAGINEVKIKGLNGVYEYPQKNDLKIYSLLFKDARGIGIELKQVQNQFIKEGDNVKSNTKFNLYANLYNNKVTLLNVRTDNITYFGDKIKSISNIEFDSLNFLGSVIVKDFKLNLIADKIDGEVISKLQNTTDKYQREVLVKELLAKGFDLDLNTDIKDIKALSQNLGFLNLKSSLKIKPDNKLFEKLQKHDISDINFFMDLKTTPQISMILMNLVPQSTFAFAFAKKDNGVVELIIKIENGEIYINGEKIKSD